jgi:signal transduction histidine kinase
MHLALLTQHLPQEKALQDRAAQMKNLLMNVINTNRDMQLALWNDKLEFLGIKAAISELVAHFNQQHGRKAKVSLPDEDANYSAEQGVALLRCVEEGLSNVLAHSQATDVDVVLDDNEDEIMLSVRDNGIGPGNEDFANLTCHGLRLVRARARHLGGELTLTPAGPQGALLRLTLPKSAPAAS